MAKFVLNLINLKLREYIEEKLPDTLDNYVYIQTLYDLYSKYVFFLTRF